MTASKDWREALHTYPGSKEPIGHRAKVEKQIEAWEEKSRILTVNGHDVEFFTIGQLAMALNRKPVTIRVWERDGVIPKAMFRMPSKDARGKHRLYTRKQVEGMIQIAREEGMLYDLSKKISTTNFSARVIELFRTAGLS